MDKENESGFGALGLGGLLIILLIFLVVLGVGGRGLLGDRFGGGNGTVNTIADDATITRALGGNVRGVDVETIRDSEDRIRNCNTNGNNHNELLRRMDTIQEQANADKIQGLRDDLIKKDTRINILEERAWTLEQNDRLRRQIQEDRACFDMNTDRRLGEIFNRVDFIERNTLEKPRLSGTAVTQWGELIPAVRDNCCRT